MAARQPCHPGQDPGQARDRTLHHTTTECRDALKREKGKRNEDGGEPHFIGASITDPRERAAGEASLERR